MRGHPAGAHGVDMNTTRHDTSSPGVRGGAPSLRATIQRHPLSVFFVLACGLSWPLVVFVAMSTCSWEGRPTSSARVDLWRFRLCWALWSSEKRSAGEGSHYTRKCADGLAVHAAVNIAGSVLFIGDHARQWWLSAAVFGVTALIVAPDLAARRLGRGRVHPRG